jgi:hypothetical protein
MELTSGMNNDKKTPLPAMRIYGGERSRPWTLNWNESLREQCPATLKSNLPRTQSSRSSSTISISSVPHDEPSSTLPNGEIIQDPPRLINSFVGHLTSDMLFGTSWLAGGAETIFCSSRLSASYSVAA